jgi:D-alanyl-lipoteichoic acid acyltransferase DltB (MBOAT superfamily)
MIDFWKRWHITLTNFVTTYLYTPILRAFGKITFSRSLLAIFLAMLISGFWHGAGWTFIIWGGMHGLGLVINHAWKKRKLKMPAWLGWLITFNFVNISFVFFRSKTVAGALDMLKGMAGLNGVMLHKSLAKIKVLSTLGITFGSWLDAINGKDETWIMIIVALLISVCWKNSMEIVSSVRPAWSWFALLLIIAFWSLQDMSKVSEFLYFQF